MTTPEWLSGLLARVDVTDICLNDDAQVYLDRGQGMELFDGRVEWGAEDLRAWALHQIAAIGKSWDARHPFVDGTLPTGHRLHVAFPPISKQGVLVSLRRLPRACESASENEAAGLKRWGASPLYTELREIVRSGKSLLISGATGSGKTTLANDLLSCVPGSQRIIALEDTPELAPCHPHFLSLISRAANADGFGEVGLRAMLRQTLRMRPDRIVLGECRGAEVLELLQALNTGHQGAMATLHASSAREALKRVELLCLLHAPGALTLGAVRELIALGIQFVAHVERGPDGRAIRELWKIEGREGETILMRQVLTELSCGNPGLRDDSRSHRGSFDRASPKDEISRNSNFLQIYKNSGVPDR